MSCASPTITSLLMVIIVQLVFICIWFDLIVLAAASTINKSSPLSSPSSPPSPSTSSSSPSSSPSSLSSSQPSLLSSASSPSSSPPSTFSVRCPLPHLIQPCDCVEIEKGGDSEFNEVTSLGLTNDTSTNDTEGGQLSGDEINANINSEPHPDIIETVVFCKHIYSREQLMESMKAFKGHRINYLVIDSCSIPPFPTNIFNQINILWMEVLNSTVQFRETFFECGAACL